MVYITSHISGEKKTLIIKKKYVSKQDILQILYEKEGTFQDVSLICEGKIIDTNNSFEGNVNIVATLQLKGGKGGFGSMLRAIGAQIEKTTNREACRDLSGRRLRDINEEKRLKDFLAKKVEKEKERLEIKKKKLDQLKEGPKHVFEDKAYFEQREKREKDIYESLDKAFASGSSVTKDESLKTIVPAVKTVSKNNKRRMLDDLDDSSDDSPDEESEEKSSEEDSSDKQQIDDTSSNSKTNEENHKEDTNIREIADSDNTEHINKKLKT